MSIGKPKKKKKVKIDRGTCEREVRIGQKQPQLYLFKLQLEFKGLE
jgi:hypothetical protein